ncbi:extracellular solute-binding protein [Phytoactinopolyspora alkaliphila]|uniref:Extracellular solute-binding protein n=1 Tax=Phytoactinopolyspora alkaliphila TaxID=1783498 RepID=A0A6N9YP54_9ACTN|nr:extracellular solute-binding protein [Phytoactinopolyspora alkaliphila]NED96725.1 extracellular solute-binding protein [Phytoactinopolyspora alkaliphila]
MRIHLRRSHAAALLIAPLLVLAACGGDDDGSGGDGDNGQEAPEPSDEPVHLTISHNATRPQIEAVWIEDYVIPEFEALMAEQGREVTVEHIEGGVDDYKTQLALDLSVGEGPDITSFDQFWTAEFAAAGLIEPLRTLVGDQVDEWEGWEQIPDAVVGSLAVDDEPYGLPLGTDGRVIFYRTDLFEDAGLPTDWQPTSWDEILDAARTLQSELPDIIPMQLNAGINMEEATTLQGYIPLLLGAGGDLHVDGMWQGDTPAVRQALEFYDTIYSEGLADTDMQLLTDGRDRSFEAFSQGNLGMLIEGDYLWRGVINPEGNFPLEDREDLVGWALIPAQEPGAGIRGQDFVSASGGTGRVINPNTEHPHEAWELLTFMSSYESQLDYVEREPRITAREDVNEDGIAHDPMLTFVAEEVLPLTWYRPGFEEYPQVSEAIQFMVENVVSGRSDVESAAQEFHSTLEGIVGPDNVAGG